MRDHYQILGVGRMASQEEIRKAYRKLALKFHPDANGGDSFYEERFVAIKEAYDVLSDPYKKGFYDAEFDRFFQRSENRSDEGYRRPTESARRSQKEDYEAEMRDRKVKEERIKRDQEQKRVIDLKRKEQMPFEDKAWIGIGSGFSLGLLGVVMAIKFLLEGYHTKARQSVIVALVGFVVLIIMGLISVATRSTTGY